MAYKIKISYATGNSFGSVDKEEYLDLEWNNLAVARKNLRRIKEHYQLSEDMKDCLTRKDMLELLEINKSKDWFVYKPMFVYKDSGLIFRLKDKPNEDNIECIPDGYTAEYCIILKTDDDKNYQLSAFWIGYFEQIHSAKIECDNIVNDMEVEFN